MYEAYRRFRNNIKNIASSNPIIFFPLFKLFGPRDKKNLLISRKTEIIIEGFPRSANTFSVVAFQMAQRRPISIAHHLHSEAQILRGVERGLPVVALIREPLPAIKSLKLIFPHIDENKSLRRWIEFYGRIEKVKDRIVMADFLTVTSDYGHVQEAINARFGTNFNVFQHTRENVAAVYSEIEAIDQQLRGGSDVYVARPSEEKRKAQQQLSFDFDTGLIDEAQAVYRVLAARC